MLILDQKIIIFYTKTDFFVGLDFDLIDFCGVNKYFALPLL
jgi:hypothetical protein